MQSAKLQKDKLELIYQIIHCENNDVIESIKSFLKNKNDYILTFEQIAILEETSEKYHSGEEPSYSWDEVKANARKNFNDKKD